MRSKATILLMLSLMAFVANGDGYAVSSMLQDIALDLNVDISEIALSVTAFMLSFGFFTLLFGPLSDRFGKANIITIAGVGSAIFSILSGFAWDIYSLIFFRAMGGIFAAGIMPVAMSLAGDTFDDHERQGALAKVLSFNFLGIASATFVGGSLAYLGSWRLVYITYGIIRLILTFFTFKLLEKDIPHTKTLSLIAFYSKAIKNKSLMLIVAIILFNGLTVLGIFSFTGLLIFEKTGYNTLIVGLMLSAFGLGSLFEKQVTPWIKKYFPQGFLFTIGIVGSMAFFSMAYFQSPIVLVLGLGIFGLTFIIIQSSLVARAQGKLPQMKGTVMSLTSCCMNMGGAIGTQINALVITSYGVDQIFANACILLLFISFFATLVNKS